MTADRWEIKTQRTNETHRMGYGDPDYQRTIQHLRKRWDTHADVWHQHSNEWVRVELNRNGGKGA
jgi:hypothetical protein